MASVYRKTVTRRLPAGADLFIRSGERRARWKDRSGKLQTAPVIEGRDGLLRIRTEAGTYTAKYRDGSGILREVATGCRSKDAALAILNELTNRADKVRSGIRTTAEDAIVDHQHTPLVEHITDYVTYLRGRNVNEQRIRTTKQRLIESAKVCGFRRLADLNADRLDGWLAEQHTAGRSAAVVNGYREVWLAFGYWCAGKRKAAQGKWRNTGEKRLTVNPFTGLYGADVKSDRRRQRRSMTDPELQRLLYVARLRPLAEYGRLKIAKAPSEQKGKRDTWELSPLTYDGLQAATERAHQRLADNPNYIEKLERRGRERALTYKMLLLTGLRRGELASLTIGNIDLDAAFPFATLEARDEKNRQGSEIPLREDLADDLRQWLMERNSIDSSGSVDVFSIASSNPAALPANTPLLNVPKQLVKTLDRDLAVAGISKIDDRGRSLDVHALRHSFGTLLSTGGVAPRTAQAAMRHSSIDLTMNVYTDPRLLDVHGALDALPQLSLNQSPEDDRRQRATGTDDATAQRTVAPMVAPNSGKRCKLGAIADNSPPKNITPKNEKPPTKVEVSRVGLTGFEPATSASRTQRSTKLSYSPIQARILSGLHQKARLKGVGSLFWGGPRPLLFFRATFRATFGGGHGGAMSTPNRVVSRRACSIIRCQRVVRAGRYGARRPTRRRPAHDSPVASNRRDA